MKSDRFPHVSCVTVESVLVGTEDYKCEKEKKSWGAELVRSDLTRPNSNITCY